MSLLKSLFTLTIVLLLSSPLISQSYAFGIKGGPSVGFQKWELFDRDPLFKYHGAVFIESDNPEFGFLGQLGYHTRGSAIRNLSFFTINGSQYRQPAREFIFNNISLLVAAKQKFPVGSSDKLFYYMLGVRGEYSLSNNLELYQEINSILNIYPFPELVNSFTYGITIGGGIELPISEFVAGIVELSLHPDLAKQYFQPPISNVIDPYSPGQTKTLSERRITNTTLELSLGLRFLRKITYID
jgi:hypothetical protein